MTFVPITFTIPGQPKGKGRARFTRTGHAYTPGPTRAYEALARLAAAQEMRGCAPHSCPVQVDIQAQLQIPASWPKAKREAALRGDIKPTGRPDVDNYVKAILDAANSVVWVDDSQVVRIVAEKRYALSPELIVTVRAA